MSQVSKSALRLAAAALGLVACGGDPRESGSNSLVGGSPSTSSGGATGSGSQSGQGGSGSVHSGGSPGAGGTLANTGATSPATGGAKASGGGPSSTGAVGGTSASIGGAGGIGGVGGLGGSVASGGKASGGGGTAAGGSSSTSPCSVSPIDPSATQATKNLLCYLYSIYTKQVLSGQQEMPWDTSRAALFDYTNTQTGKYPAIWGGDYLYTGEVAEAKAYSTAGGIIMMRYHMGAPPNADTYENSKGTVANFDNLTKAGTAENTSLNSKLDNMASQLKELGVPVIMVPYHEVDQFAWFWWSKGTGAQFQALWKYTVDYVNQTKGVHNVLWTLGFGHDGAMAAYYPGKDFVDLGGIDEYDKDTQPFATQWTSAKGVFGATLPIPLHETGTIPQPSDMWSKGTTWLLWNVWCNYLNTVQENYTWNTADTLKSAYADAHTITRDEVPTNLK